MFEQLCPWFVPAAERAVLARHVIVALVLAMRLNRWLKKLSGSLLPLGAQRTGGEISSQLAL
jgi:hypothetical protein